MTQSYPKISQLGDRSILIQFKPIISEILLDEILYIQQKIKKFYKERNVEISNSYRELLIVYGATITDFSSDLDALKLIIENVTFEAPDSKTVYEVPVCYDTQFGIDLEFISKRNNLSVSEIIELHTKPLYRVYFMGFLPGFLYLGGLEEKLHISRKEQPRLKIEKGAVGIGEQQTGIYPQESPGGWQIIGNCPIPFFDINNHPPSPIEAGSYIRFSSISIAEYENVKKAVENNQYQLKSTQYER